jgi:glycosyltransferase involved in cell wall biosynthesis
VEIVAGRQIVASDLQPHPNLRMYCIAPRGAWDFLWRLPKWMRMRPPGVLVTTSNDIAVWVLLWRRLLRMRSAVVVTQHLAISGPRTGARGLRRLKLECVRCAMRLGFPTADAIVAVSAAVAADMCAELGLPASAIRVIHNPIVAAGHSTRIVPARPRPDAWPFAQDGVPVVIFVGRLSQEKRLDLLFAAFLQVRAQHPVRLLVVGDGGMAVPLRGWIMAHGVDAECQLVGRVADVLPWIQHSDVLALPSDYEGFGNVLVEAMQCATQIVATDCPSGPAEILDHGRYGQLVPVGDPQALGEALLSSLAGRFHVDPRALLGRAAEFSIDRAVDAYVEVFTSVSGRSEPAYVR